MKRELSLSTRSSPVILFQPQNHVGLGHMNRMSAIALALRSIDPSVRTPFVVEGAAHALLEALGLPYVPLPSSHFLYETDNWSLWSVEDRERLCREISSRILNCLNPQVVVFDSVPNQAFAAAVLAARLPVVLCLRQVNHLERFLERLADFLPHVHQILIPHEEGTFEMPPELRIKSCFVGEILRPSVDNADSSREPGRLSVVIHGGGGGYPGTVDFFNAAIEAFALMRRGGAMLKGRLVTGPLFTDWKHLRLTDGLSAVPFDPELTLTLAGVDLVICQAGYNTIAELKRVATRVLVVPAERKWDDQMARADQAAAASRNFRVFRGNGAHELAQEAVEFLTQPTPILNIGRADGAERAAIRILELLPKPMSST